MAISVTKFKDSCLEIIRQVEKTGQSVAITRRGKAVARLTAPTEFSRSTVLKPWEQLRLLGGQLLAAPDESVITDKEFEALR